MPKTIRPDGSLDPLADFEDDGASFRVRREAELRAKYAPKKKGWSWNYLFSSPATATEASEQAVKMFLKGFGIVLLLVFLFLGTLFVLALFNIVH